jgi:hypothetical protein
MTSKQAKLRKARQIAAAAAFILAMLGTAQAQDACAPKPKEQLCEQLAETAFERCYAKTLRFEGTQATPEAQARFMWHCGFQAGVWQRRDP